MAGIIEYAEQNLNRLDQDPFNEVDSLVLSQPAYLQLGCLVPSRGKWGSLPLSALFKAEYFPKLLHQVRAAEQNKRLLTAVCASPRFRDMQLCGYVDERDIQEEKQFVAVTFLLGDRRRYLAFRGTDADVVGWKEDFNMAFKTPVPAQKAALEYLTHAVRTSRDKIILGGHSKGGNLAAYSAIYAGINVQSRVEACYSHDGPGFKDPLNTHLGFLRVQQRLHKTIPQSALVGMLLEHQEHYSVVKSDRIGLWQHDPFSWQVEQGRFVRVEEISAGARHMNATLNSWLKTQSDQQREQFVEILFGVLETGNIHSFAEDQWDWQQVPALLEALKNTDGETRKVLLHTFKELALLAVKTLPQTGRK